jgi:Carboxypeptidase regulatory-like domain
MKRTANILFFASLLSLAIASLARAQGTAQISGTVKDQTGAVLPGVEINATQTETGITRSTVTNETGTYVLPNLALGPYRVESTLPGFRTFVQTGIVLQVNSSPVINPILEVGQVAETVEVQANAAMVETRNSGVGQVIENERILELPLNGRNVNDLIVLAGAAVQTGTTADRQIGGTPVLSIGGGVAFTTAYSLDGAQHINFFTYNSMPMPFPDALQEFKVETSGLSAQAGQSTSVNAVTKAGTNELHGDLFEFVRNDLFNARNYFATKHSTLKRNQFGGTVGGPISRNKLFFFGGVQRTTLRRDPADTRAFVPTADMLAGDWTAFTSPACNAGRQITLRAPFVNNRVDPALFSKAAVNITKLLPKAANACGEITYGRRTQTNEGQYIAKIDYQWTANHSLFGRYVANTVFTPHPFKFTPDNALNLDGTETDNLAQSYALGSTYLIGPNMVNSFRMAVNRGAAGQGGVDFSANSCTLGIDIYCGYNPRRPSQFVVTGGFTLGGSRGIPADLYITTGYQVSDDLSIVHGNHQMSFGYFLAHARHNTNSTFITAGVFRFTGSATGNGMGDFFLGRIAGFQQGEPTRHYVRQWYTAAYGADTWKATQKLTINYGIRWEPFLPVQNTNRAVYAFNYDRFNQGIKSTVFPNAPAGFHYPGDPGFPGITGIHSHFLDVAPRLGFAWDVKGDGRTSVRASYGYSYAYLPLEWRIDAGRAAPFGSEIGLVPQSLDNPWAGVPGGNMFPVVRDVTARFVPYGVFLTLNNYDTKTTATSTWNLNLQKQIASNWLASATYMGSQTAHLWTLQAINASAYIPGGPCTLSGVTYPTCSTTANTNQRRRFSLERPQDGQYIGLIAQYDDGGTMSYNGMLLSLQRRSTRGWTLGANYTWSHCIGDYGDVHGEGPESYDTYTDPNNRSFDRGDCRGDRRQVFNFTPVYETPQFGNNTVRMLATGWRLAGIYRYSSGPPLTILAGEDRALNGDSRNQRASQVLANGYGDRSARPNTNYLDPAAFALAPVGSLGNMGRGNLQGPGTWQFDIALSRTFQLRENKKLELRGEAYNLTNSFRPDDFTLGQAGSSQALNSNTFGQIRTARDPRIMQFALKFVF